MVSIIGISSRDLLVGAPSFMSVPARSRVEVYPRIRSVDSEARLAAIILLYRRPNLTESSSAYPFHFLIMKLLI